MLAAGCDEMVTKPFREEQIFDALERVAGIRFVYEGQGEHTFREGDCVLQPARIVHNELECSDDVEILEIYSPAVHETRVVDRMPEATAAAR